MTDRPIEDYAVIGDTCTTALVARDGSIDWLCWPCHDSPATFLRLLDEDKGGFCDLVLDGLSETHRRYRPGTCILETTFVTATGTARLTDFMPIHPLEAVPEEGPDGDPRGRIVRLLTCEAGTVTGRFRVRPTFDYARDGAALESEANGTVLCRRLGAAEGVRVAASVPLAITGDRVEAAFSLRAGEGASLVLAHREDDDGDVGRAEESLSATHDYWEEWSGRCTYDGPHRDSVLRSALVLKLLTHAPSGGIIAAATTSLPEAVPGTRNFDYRYVWMRDASFTVTAFVNLGYVREAAEFLRFLRDADQTRGRDLKLMYGINGRVPEEEILDHLRGWRGVGPVRIGNAASGQHQYDIYGEFLVALHAFLDAVGYDPPVKVNDHLPEALGHLTDHVIRCRHAPDHGIWELRDETRQILHTKGMLWVALDRAVQIAQAVDVASPDRVEEWRRVAAEIRAEYHEKGWSERVGAYTQSYGSDDLDAAVLRTVLFGAFDAHSPRVAATLEAVSAGLGDGDLIYRYRNGDGFEHPEATFAACAFWRVGCLALAGRTHEAEPLFARLLTRGNDLGLFAEEIDAASGEQRGNVPQGFTHMAIINHAVRLDRAALHREARTDEPCQWAVGA
ncbi:glycoside hydrolase family 15 protein [Methylobacterium frigidaeris]|uniref:Trehalase n=1 Tax=Methylobacterium frigidaeris TaxID=2038277 RepID=A0AA37HCG7_9HYPH|nr:glycoside hydrolase family 15 protein [Methylobacterium frigidaeris]PIK69340.1 glycoside hydrolase [Methylobacterium frigidaeris]GJD63299.1 Trehalase [Methylobacterium frigidaeris]